MLGSSLPDTDYKIQWPEFHTENAKPPAPLGFYNNENLQYGEYMRNQPHTPYHAPTLLLIIHRTNSLVCSFFLAKLLMQCLDLLLHIHALEVAHVSLALAVGVAVKALNSRLLPARELVF